MLSPRPRTPCSRGGLFPYGEHSRTKHCALICWSWKSSNVTDREATFANAAAFNQNLTDWCVSLIHAEPTDFRASATTWSRGQPAWGTCYV
ncbi:MAG: BspA family leucine-rich repeat surface protein [Actinobacteria bacterium]|nr:BspA family leucine-rich repeat surface protein [Actinomycetota bacterium]